MGLFQEDGRDLCGRCAAAAESGAPIVNDNARTGYDLDASGHHM